MLDLSFLEKFTKGDSKKMKRYIQLYLDVVPDTFEKMQQNQEDNDWKQLRINAHSLKPQAEFMGMLSLKEKLVEIEEAIRNEIIDPVGYLLKTAHNIHLSHEKELTEYMLGL